MHKPEHRGYLQERRGRNGEHLPLTAIFILFFKGSEVNLAKYLHL